MRRRTGPAINQDGTSRAEPGTRAVPPSVGDTAKPTADITLPRALQRNRGLMSNPAATRLVAGATSGIAPILPDGRRSRCSPPELRTSGVRSSRLRAGSLAARNGSIHRSPWAPTIRPSTCTGLPSSTVRSNGLTFGAAAVKPARARPRAVRPRLTTWCHQRAPRCDRRLRRPPRWPDRGDAPARSPAAVARARVGVAW